MTERRNIIMDSQILNSVQACAFKTDLTFNQDLVPPTKATPLEEGDLMHRMFEHYNLGVKEQGTELLYDNDRWKAHVDETLEFGERQALELELLPAEVSEVLFQTGAYLKHTRMDGIEILDVERAFLLNLYEDNDLRILYAGKIDRMTNTPKYGICPRDYKKTKRNETPSKTSNQFSGYAYATMEMTGNKMPVVFVDKVGFQKTLPPEERFRSYDLVYTEDMLNRWKANTIWWGKQLAFYTETNTWPQNFTSCDKYAGCIFLPVCEANTDESMSHKMATMFIKGRKWDPTNVLKGTR